MANLQNHDRNYIFHGTKRPLAASNYQTFEPSHYPQGKNCQVAVPSLSLLFRGPEKFDRARDTRYFLFYNGKRSIREIRTRPEIRKIGFSVETRNFFSSFFENISSNESEYLYREVEICRLDWVIFLICLWEMLISLMSVSYRLKIKKKTKKRYFHSSLTSTSVQWSAPF